jgi:hypothetical protein
LQQVNLLSQMLAGLSGTGQTGSATGNASGQMGAGSLDFMLFLQQQVWSGGLPKLAQDTADPKFAQALQDAGFSSLLAENQATTGMVTSGSQAATSAVPQLPTGGLLQALIDGLQQILDATASMESTLNAQVSTEGQAGEMLTAGASTASVTTAAQTAQLAAQYPALNVLDAWQQAISGINTALSNELGVGYQLTSSQPQLQGQNQGQPQLPWSMLGASNIAADSAQALTQALAGNSGTVVQPAGEIAAQDLMGFGTAPQQAPAVIQWFVEQGLMSEAGVAQASSQAAQADAAQLASDAAVVAGKASLQTSVAAPAGHAQPNPVVTGQAVTGSVQLANGEDAQVTLTLLNQATKTVGATGAAQGAEYAVRMEVPGDPASVITATLSVERVAYSLPTPWPSASGQPLALPVQLATALDAQTPASQPAPSPQVESAPGPAAPLSQTAGKVLAADIVAENLASGLTIPPQPEASATTPAIRQAWRVVDGAVQVLNQQASQASATAQGAAPELVASQAVQVEASQPSVRKQASPAPAQAVVEAAAATVELAGAETEAEASVIQQALKLDRQAAAAEPFAAEFTALSRLAVATVAADSTPDQPSLNMLEGSGQLLANSQPSQLPLSLLQFTRATDALQPFSSLNYLELAQRVQNEAAQARSHGDGTYTARLNLNPPNLGQLYVNIAVRGETVALQMAVASTVPKVKLEESMAQLKQSLEDAGLTVVELKVVQVGSQGDSSSQEQPQHQQQQHQPGKRAAVLEPEVIKAATQFGRAAQAVPAAS